METFDLKVAPKSFLFFSTSFMSLTNPPTMYVKKNAQPAGVSNKKDMQPGKATYTSNS